MKALYRKYRPKTLEDVLGQNTITTIIRNAARQDRLAHAYLFYGQRGSGKTTTARLLAKIANCEKRLSDSKFRETGEPCNECQACMEIDNGQALDVIEIDAASNRGIDEIRNLREGIRLAPTSYRYKVFIIDEVHQLTKEAFNALLKTLEEPPAHAILILATTEFDKVPATISSRAQRFNFKKATIPELVAKLKKIAQNESIEFTDEGLEIIAAASDGSFRDAESLFEQIKNIDGSVTAENVAISLGHIGLVKVSQLTDLIIAGDLEKSLSFLHSIEEEGYNLTQFAKDLINYFRRILALHFSPALESEYKKIFTEKEVKTLISQSKTVKPDKAIAIVKALINAYSQMKYSPFAAVPLEVAMIETLKS